MASEDWRTSVSKRMAGLLRHYGPRYGVILDREGWARIADVVAALRRMGYNVTERDILEIAASDPKGRYEVREGMIRARYGHSLPVRIRYEPARDAPPLLYHGTPARNLASIMRRGLLPGRRLYVHLTATRDLAVETGRRHGRPVAVLAVDVRCLRERGIEVYRAGPLVFLAEHVPPECIRVLGLER